MARRRWRERLLCGRRHGATAVVVVVVVEEGARRVSRKLQRAAGKQERLSASRRNGPNSSGQAQVSAAPPMACETVKRWDVPAGVGCAVYFWSQSTLLTATARLRRVKKSPGRRSAAPPNQNNVTTLLHRHGDAAGRGRRALIYRT